MKNNYIHNFVGLKMKEHLEQESRRSRLLGEDYTAKFKDRVSLICYSSNTSSELINFADRIFSHENNAHLYPYAFDLIVREK